MIRRRKKRNPTPPHSGRARRRSGPQTIRLAPTGSGTQTGMPKGWAVLCGLDKKLVAISRYPHNLFTGAPQQCSQRYDLLHCLEVLHVSVAVASYP